MNFITFEGGEGSGKTTQSKLLHKAYENAGIPVILTREPGGTEAAEQIREILLKGDKDKLHPISELLLHSAARVEHVKKLIEPSLKEGKVVICDRFVDSTMAYQGFGHRLGRQMPAMVHNITMKGTAPDITFIMDIDPALGLERSKKQGDINRYEKQDHSFHERVRKGFQEISNMASGRCISMNAQTRSLKDIHKEIIDIINDTTGVELKPVDPESI